MQAMFHQPKSSANFVCNDYALDKVLFRRETENDVIDISFTYFQQ